MLKIFEELQFAVVAEPHSHYVEYTIYETFSCYDGTILYQRKNSPVSPDPVSSIEEAEKFIEGSVKWDGCSNWDLGADSDGMKHFCNKKSLENIGKILAECWDMTKTLCPNWSA